MMRAASSNGNEYVRNTETVVVVKWDKLCSAMDT